ncbi:hypothetical protein Salat_2092300, partial [Sesamum alatum]
VNSSIHLRKGRGRRKPIVRWNSGVKLQVKLTPHIKIDGPNRIEFKTQLGVLDQNSYICSLIYISFREIPQHLLDNLWYEIKENTTFPDEAKDVVLEDFYVKWRQGKYEVKRKHLRPYVDDEERLDVLSVDRVSPEQLKTLVDYWKLDKAKAEVERNVQTIAQYKFHHQLGRTLILKLEKQNQLRETAPRVSDAECTKEFKEMVFVKFMGADDHGHIRCGGQGGKPSQYRHTISSNDAIKKKIREEVVPEIKEEMREQREQM